MYVCINETTRHLNFVIFRLLQIFYGLFRRFIYIFLTFSNIKTHKVIIYNIIYVYIYNIYKIIYIIYIHIQNIQIHISWYYISNFLFFYQIIFIMFN